MIRIFTEVDMKKFTLFFALLLFFGVLTAEEVQNEPVAAQTEEKAAAEETKPAEPAKPAEESEQAEEKQPETEAKEESAEVETVPEIEEKQPEVASEEAEPQETAPAEEAKEEVAQPQQVTMEEAKTAETQEEEKPSRVFYQLSAGLGIGASIFSFRINNDIDFLLKHTKGGTNVYLGLEVDFRYSPYIDDHSIYEIPLQLNFMFDFPLRHHNISRLALWFSAGVDLAIGYLSYYDYDDDEWGDTYDDKDRDSHFKLMAAWGFGVNMLFRNDVTLKLGFDSFYGKYPDIICAAGYRF